MPKLTLNKTDKKFMGVCAGLADWAEIDTSLVRLLFLLAAVLGAGSPILIYLVLAFILD
jgi:phage shock protein C